MKVKFFLLFRIVTFTLEITARFAALEARLNGQSEAPKDSTLKNSAEDDDIDLFGSDDEDDDAEKIKAERIAAYNEKKKVVCACK